ncbi:Ethylmalonyl-CoA decarboxylase [Orchesella cincta]|uniref:Ethylmalonyl-CoA decarboxylase n=1 Tax=Orchesella cincta TaxID=48709 RepID=A0A1D2NCJ4_ORCCI|nr:Ethylmalonyl-CoA decarboxylase [Orchesella cincta]
MACSGCAALKLVSNRNLKVLGSRYVYTNVKKYAASPLTEIREQFRKFVGGGVSLRKNEDNGIAYIAIDHVKKKNGFSGKMMVDLNDAVLELESWKTGKGVILYGAGGTFCSGGYLDTVRNICNSEDGYKMATLMHDSVMRLRNLPFVSVSLVTGKAIGGGAELMLATDFRLMSYSSEIRFVEARMGVGTGWAGGTLLQQLVGHRTALDLLLTCRKVSADEALVLGLADDLIEEKDDDDDEAAVMKATEWLNERIASHHHSVVQTIKGIVVCNDLEEERRIFSTTWGGKAQQDALNKNIKHNN